MTLTLVIPYVLLLLSNFLQSRHLKKKKIGFFDSTSIIFSVTKKIRENAFCYLKSQDYRIR